MSNEEKVFNRSFEAFPRVMTGNGWDVWDENHEKRAGYIVGYQDSEHEVLKIAEELADHKRLLKKSEDRFSGTWTRDEEGFLSDSDADLRYAYTEGYQAALKDLRDKLLNKEVQ